MVLIDRQENFIFCCFWSKMLMLDYIGFWYALHSLVVMIYWFLSFPHLPNEVSAHHYHTEHQQFQTGDNLEWAPLRLSLLKKMSWYEFINCRGEPEEEKQSEYVDTILISWYLNLISGWYHHQPALSSCPQLSNFESWNKNSWDWDVWKCPLSSQTIQFCVKHKLLSFMPVRLPLKPFTKSKLKITRP